jgi:hypothetical protein
MEELPKVARLIPGALSSVHKGLADIPNLESRWGFDVIPILASERVDNLLFHTLFASFSKAL